MSPPVVAKFSIASLVMSLGRDERPVVAANHPLRLSVVLALCLLVTACGGGGGSRVPVPLRALPPLAPGSFMADLRPSNDQALLTWEAPETASNRAPVTGYRVYLQLPGGGARRLGDTQSRSYIHSIDSGLPPGNRYVYHVLALSVVGTSQPSASAFVDFPVRGGPVVPLDVPHVTVTADSGDGMTVEVSWVHRPIPEPSEGESGFRARLIGFSVQFCDVPPDQTNDHCRGDWQDFKDPKDPQGDPQFGPTERAFTEPVNCNPTDPATDRVARMYRVRARADETSYSSRYSVPTRPVCPSMDYSPPRRVDAVFAAEDAMGGKRVNVCWGVPETNGDPLIGYELQVTRDAVLPATEDGWLIVDAHVSLGTSPVCRLYAGLADGDQRWFRVRAYNSAGHGHWSAPYHYTHEAATVPPLPMRRSARVSNTLTVTDARAREGTDAALVFEVTLDRAASEPVTVDYDTVDRTAKAGEDYRSASGTLEFASDETSKSIAVTVVADAKDEGDETFTLVLSNAAGARIADGEATGTIDDHASMRNAWLARFGRTIAVQVVDAVGARVEGTPGAHVTVGGMSLGTSTAAVAENRHRGATESRRDVGEGPERTRTLAGPELLAGSSFHLVSDGDGPVYAAWGRFATDGFEADVHDMRMDGEVTTGFLGADIENDRWLAGAAFSYTEADGSYRSGSRTTSERDRRESDATLTGVYPYARLRLTERASLWGLAGVGQGRFTLAEDGRAPVATDIDMTMGAFGARGSVLSPSEAAGFELAIRSDAFWVRMSSDAVRAETGRIPADSRADASRLRLSLEGARAFALGARRTLTPAIEVGVRHDSGDAETGTGIEAGAAIRYAGDGVAIEGAVRTLVAHEESGFEEWGASGSVRIDPGATGRGLSLTLAPTFGTASSGAERLWSRGDMRALAGDADVQAGRRLEARVGYGMSLPQARGTVTPYTGVSLGDDGARAWRLGARMPMATDLILGLEGIRRERAGDAPEQAVTLHGNLRW